MTWMQLAAIPARPFALLTLLIIAHVIASFVYKRLPEGKLRTFLFRPRMIIKRPEDYAQ